MGKARGRPTVTLELSPEIRGELERRVKAATSTQREAGRAQVILECSGGASAKDVAKKLRTSSARVVRWRGRFRRNGLSGLEDLPRPGHPPQFTPLVHAELVAIACEPISKKDEQEKGITTRTIEAIREEAIGREIVPEISWSSVQRILDRLDIKPHREKQWLHSRDPRFRELVNEITDLYLNPPPDSVVISVDEKPGMQSLERRPDRPEAPGRRRRREFEYERRGTQALIGGFVVHTGRVLGHCGDTRSAADLLGFMEDVAREYPTGDVHVIWDNLNIHMDGPDKRWTEFNERHGHRFFFHYTPLHASWVNQIELFFGILQRLCLRHGNFSSTAELRTAVLAFLATWNRERAHPFKWTFKGYPLQSGIEDLKKTA